MSRAKLFNMIKSRGMQQNGRNDFDLSNGHVYTQKAGVITPIKAIHTLPDDFHDIVCDDFSQTLNPMKTASFLRGSKELSAYFVPYNTVWHLFNQYQATREDSESANLRGIVVEPRVSVYELYRVAVDMYYDYYYYTYVLRAAEHFGVLPSGKDLETARSEFLNLIKPRFTATNMLYVLGVAVFDAFNVMNFADMVEGDYTTGYPQGFYYENSSSATQFGYYPRDFSQNLLSQWTWCDWIRKMDMLGYGNIYPVFRALEKKLDEVWTNNIDTTSTFAAYCQDFVEMFLRTINTLKNMTSATALVKSSDTPTTSTYIMRGTHTYVNVYALFAYNKIFYDVFRNTYYDLDYNVRNYNCDFVDTSTISSGVLFMYQLPPRFFHLESHQWKKDMFTGVLPDMQFGVVQGFEFTPDVKASVVPDSDLQTWHVYGEKDGFPGNHNLLTAYGEKNITFYKNQTHVVTHSHSVDVSVGRSKIDVLAIRRAECLQQYYMDLMRAGNRTRDIFKQVYGTSPKSQLEESPYFIEVANNPINVNPIVSTSQTGDGANQNLGDIAARAVTNGESLRFKFSTNDFGCIIFLSYLVPESMYNSYRIDPHLQNLSPESHFLPYTMNLGYDIVLGDTLSNLGDASIRNRTIGFAPSYLEFKTDIDLVHGALVDAMYLNDDSKDFISVDYNGDYSQWVVARTDMQLQKTTALRNFYVDYRVLNNIFEFEAGPDYTTDHFLCICNIRDMAVRQLSELGLPRFC